jgi:hypothetical protein
MIELTNKAVVKEEIRVFLASASPHMKLLNQYYSAGALLSAIAEISGVTISEPDIVNGTEHCWEKRFICEGRRYVVDGNALQCEHSISIVE